MGRGDLPSILERLRGGLIVSCQAGEESALHDAIFIAALAKEAERGGAVGLRLNGPQNIAAVRRQTTLPILGIFKQQRPGWDVYITPTVESARAVAEAGADIVATAISKTPRPDGLSIAQFIRSLHELDLPVMADVSTPDEGRLAADAGADIVATTMSGYTPHSRPPLPHQPDLELIRVKAAVSVPIIAEGRITTPEQAAAALDAGAHAVVVGTAITAPAAITRRFVEGLYAAR